MLRNISHSQEQILGLLMLFSLRNRWAVGGSCGSECMDYHSGSRISEPSGEGVRLMYIVLYRTVRPHLKSLRNKIGPFM